MRALSAAELLDVWEAGYVEAPVERALLLLAAACPESSRDKLAALTIGARDAMLLTLRQKLAGPLMEAVAGCPACGERLEMALDTRQMLSLPRAEPPGKIQISFQGEDLTFRLPTSQDLLTAMSQADEMIWQLSIIHNCQLNECTQGETNKLPENALPLIGQAIADADPLADIQLSLKCPACQHQWQAVFDIVSFLWTEIEVWAWRMLSDVHTLARAYGWGEREIVTLSPTRRQFYLEMVGA
jgi:hypothetical protein